MTKLQRSQHPFNPTTTIGFELPQDANVRLEVFDMLGREVATLINEFREAGGYAHQFDASRLSSGVYYYTLRAGTFSATKHFTLVK